MGRFGMACPEGSINARFLRLKACGSPVEARCGVVGFSNDYDFFLIGLLLPMLGNLSRKSIGVYPLMLVMLGYLQFREQ